MTSRQSATIVCTCIAIAALACNTATSVAPANPTLPITETVLQPPTPTEAEVDTAQPAVSLEEFSATLKEALISEDMGRIRPLMGNAFSVTYVDASGGFIATDDALNLLQTEFLVAPPPSALMIQSTPVRFKATLPILQA